MASSANSHPLPKLYKSVIEDVINDVRELFLDEGVDEQVLVELRTLWESKLLQSKAVEGFHNDEHQQVLQAQREPVQVQQPPQQNQNQQVIPPATQQVPQQQVIVQDSKILQHVNASGMSAAATAATLALPTGVGPYQQLVTSQGQVLQLMRVPNGTQYIIQPQQHVVLQQQVLSQMQPGGVQGPVIQQVLAPLPGGIPQQTGVIIQPQQIVISGNKVPPNTQVVQTLTVQPGQAASQVQPQAQQQPPVVQPPVMLQVDGTGDTSSEDEEEEEYDEDEEEDKEKDGGEDGQVEEESLNSEDDVSDEEDQELFDTENVVVCQYDKVPKTNDDFHAAKCGTKVKNNILKDHAIVCPRPQGIMVYTI
ncbi:transcription initiation factor IIA subunit 1-like isoform X2 [Scleropages formosus]|uniref:transcription initiation factor IIA subunit 1-like isoform X2 n=1 Tax=Scleropages formosus TaxID=113540 RepID=UPI00087811E0|nr:transcription initiation factor IIA subunit 1-like isoform X2 [Scleropages formosus]